jgi:hypothetical protein
VAEEHKLCSLALMSMLSYVHQDMFLGSVPRLVEEHKLYSSTINICFLVFGRRTFVFPVVQAGVVHRRAVIGCCCLAQCFCQFGGWLASLVGGDFGGLGERPSHLKPRC